MTSRYALLPAATAAVVLLLALVLPFAGCGLPLQGLPSDADAGTPCNADSQCVDMNPCTADTCVAGGCKHIGQPDGPAPSASQTAFDCKAVICKSGQSAVENDNTDIQADAEDCTVDNCNAGEAFHTAKPDSTPCTMGGDGICVGGKCQILCTSNTMCDDKNPCTVDTCDVAQGLCSFSPLNGVDTPGSAQIDFDCNVQVCVDGVNTKSPDDSDLPKTATDCDQELCNGGVASNPPLDLDVSCGAAKDQFCDGAGACVQCNSPTQCPGVDDDCQVRSCTAHVCGITFQPAGTPRAANFQTLGDCTDVVCDGAGASAAQPKPNDADLPDDGNKCTKDICTGGVISHQFEAVNTVCGNNSACNPVGQCGCANDAACLPLPNTCGGGNPGTMFICGCTPKSCAMVGKTCGTASDGCFSTQPCDNGSKEGSETDIDCGGGAAGTCGNTCAQGKQCNADTDCATGHCADGVCCSAACTNTCLACTAAKKGGGVDGVCGSIALGLQDTNAAMTCVGVKACDGANNCKKIDGQSCSQNSECVNGSCADGVCCNTSCTGTCLACSALKKGSGVDGVCGNIAINQPDNAATVTCTGTNACDGNGVCKKIVGQSCANNGICANGNCVDGFCCGSASCGTCQSCGVAGTLGACTNLANGSADNNPVGTCVGTSACDGNGVCKKSNGQTCATTAECATGTCVDFVCCGSMSCPTCQSCAINGNGTCSNIPNGTPDTVPANACTTSCNGSGICKTAPGLACPVGGAMDCQNGNCVDGVCCGVPSCPTCQSCALGAAGTCGNIPNGTPDTVPANACTTSCNGSGICKTAPGLACPAGGAMDCQNGNCVDGVCCGVPSCPTCQSCALGAAGTCADIPNGTPDTVPVNACTTSCDGAGICKTAVGLACPAGGAADCQSGFCADGFCCNVKCDSADMCMTCNGATPGTCTQVKGADDADSCPPATKTCDAAGACLLKMGQPCTIMNAALCASGVCAPGVFTCL